MILSWNITKRCNLYCEHCYRDSDMHCAENELTTEEGIQLINEIKATGRFKILILSGGEPLLREDLEIFAAHARQVGLIPVLGTNATLMTKERAMSLKEAGVAAAGVSLDACTAEHHDRFRDTPGSFDAAIKGIENCIEVGMRVQINTTVTRENVNQLDDIIEFSETLGAGACHPFFLVEAGRGSCIAEKALDDDAYFSTLRQILNKQEHVNLELKPTCAPQFMSLAKEMGVQMRFTKGCIAGTGYCCILPNGDVHICPYLPVEAGSIRRDGGFQSVWENSEVFKTLRNKEAYKGRCGSCADSSICGGCRARAFYRTGNYMDEDPISKHCFKIGE